MFDIAWTEMLVIAVVTIVVVGPRDLPKVMRSVGSMVSKARALAGKFQSDMDQLARETELDDLRREAREMREHLNAPKRELNRMVNPLADEPAPARKPIPDSAGAEPPATLAGDEAPKPEPALPVPDATPAPGEVGRG